jgi:hypothetical protein
MYYNTNFDVKYHNIKTELLNKFKENKNVDEIDYKYNEDDINIICRKLYIDELNSVFFANSIFDDTIDINMRQLFTILMQNKQFKDFIETIIFELTNNNINLDNNLFETFYIIFIALFDENLFYLTHQFLYELITKNNFNYSLLVIMKSKTLELFI